MTARTQLLTLQEYLESDRVTEKHYELIAGKLIQMPPQSPQNAEIAIKLLLIFARFVSSRLLRCKDTEIVVSGSRATVRLPDLMVLTEDLADDLYNSKRSTITIDMLPPALVVEVVSPGKVNCDRDYRYKRCSAVLGGAFKGQTQVLPPAPWLSPMSDTALEECNVPKGRWRVAPFKKRSEYAARGIAEYWIVDPQENVVTVLICERGLYRETVYRGNESIYSPLFPQLQLNTNQIFS